MIRTPKNINVYLIYSVLLLFLYSPLQGHAQDSVQRLDLFEVTVEEQVNVPLSSELTVSEFYHYEAPQPLPYQTSPEDDLWLLEHLSEDTNSPAVQTTRREGE